MLHGHELNTPTWRNLSRALAAFEVKHEACFFSNALMGLMERAGPCGSHPGHRDRAFRVGCIHVLEATLMAQRPRLVLALGKHAPRVLAGAVPGLDAWRRPWSFESFDAARLHEVGLDTLLPGTGQQDGMCDSNAPIPWSKQREAKVRGRPVRPRCRNGDG